MIGRTNLICLCAVFAMLPCGYVHAEDNADIAVLKQRVAALEKKVAELEAKLAAAPAAGGGTAAATPAAGKATSDDARASRRAMFNKRMAQAQKKYSSQ